MDSKLDSQFRRQSDSYIRSSTDIWLVTQKPHFYRHVPKETKHANTHRKQVHCHFTAALLKISKYRNNYVVSQKSMECFYPWAYPSVQRYDVHAAQVDARDLLQSEQTDSVSILCTSPTEPGLPLTAGTVTWDLRGAGLLLHTCAFMLCSIIKIHRAILVKVWHYCTDYTPQEEWQWGAHSGISHSKERMTSSSKSSVWFAGACTRVHMCESRYVCQAYLWRSKVTQDRLALSNKHTSCSSLEENDP